MSSIPNLDAAPQSYLSRDNIESFYDQCYVVVKGAWNNEEIQKMADLTNKVIQQIFALFLYSEVAKKYSEIGKEYQVYLDGSQVVFKKMEDGISIKRVVGCGSMKPELQTILRSDKIAHTFFSLLR